MNDPLIPRSMVEGLAWPGIPEPRGRALLAMQYQLERSQWWPPEVIRRQQLRQLTGLLRHARATVPFYRRRFDEAGWALDGELDEAAWARLPLLTRRDIQDAGDELVSTALPKSHGRVHSLSTSGSSGTPVTVRGTELTQFFWLSFTLRDQLWHGIDVRGKLAAIRFTRDRPANYPGGQRAPTWGPSTNPVYVTGPSAVLSIATPVPQQVEWLRREDPDCLITYPTNLMSLLTYCRVEGIQLPRLKTIETLSEILTPDVRAACREVWGLEIVDMYSSQEVGYIALQCPEHEHYHVQSEGVLVEILDQAGRPCAPGQTGRVVVTPLHNFAMPLIRYSLGDFAVAGGRCPCGRGLPVIARVLGRARNMLTLPSGEKVWPVFGGDTFPTVAPIAQYQLVQKSREELELRIVPKRPMTAAEESAVRGLIEERLGKGFRIVFSYRDTIPRSAGGKFEDFRSELPE